MSADRLTEAQYATLIEAAVSPIVLYGGRWKRVGGNRTITRRVVDGLTAAGLLAPGVTRFGGPMRRLTDEGRRRIGRRPLPSPRATVDAPVSLADRIAP